MKNRKLRTGSVQNGVYIGEEKGGGKRRWKFDGGETVTARGDSVGRGDVGAVM